MANVTVVSHFTKVASNDMSMAVTIIFLTF